MNNQPPKYFQPGFRENQKEHDISSLHVTGTIPSWLSGSLLRNGPGLVVAGKATRHWFDGLAMLHKFVINNGEVSYKSRFVDCEAYKATKNTGKIVYSDFATDPCRSLFQKLQTIFEKDPKITDSAKVNVGKVGDKFYALGEPLMQIQIDPDTLKSLGVFHYGKNPASRMTTAHPQSDGDSAYNLVVEYGPVNFYSIYSMTDPVKKVASVPVREPAYIHSFGMSSRYFIIAEFPFVVQSLKLVFRLKPFIENFKWKPSNGSRFLIIDRESGKLVSTIRTESFFSFHHVNAFEDGDKLVVDMAAYEDADIISHYYMNRLSENGDQLPFGRMTRFVLDLKNKTVIERKTISESCIELPHIDYRSNRNGAYRYVYGCGIHEAERNGFYNQLLKIDMQTGAELRWYQPGFYPGEPVFVPNPDGTSEDDGVILSVALDAEHGNSVLLVLNAKDFHEQARAQLPHPVLFGYHGTFLNKS